MNVRKRKMPETMVFKDLKAGDVFRWNDDEDVYLRMENGSDYVCLRNGNYYACNLDLIDLEVQRVSGQFVEDA